MIQFINQWQQVLTAAVAPTDVTILISDANALVFGGATDTYRLTIQKGGTNQYEVVQVTGRTGNNLNVERAQELTTALSFIAGDLVDIRLTAGEAQSWSKTEEGLSLDANFNVQGNLAKAVVSASADLTQANAQKLVSVAAIKDYVDQSSPVGMIVAWNPGYYSNTVNGGFSLTLGAGNNVAAANAYLNPKGWYVCDGAALNLAGSLIFNGAGRNLPNLTDNRFLKGAAGVGTSGGSNIMANHTHGHSLTTANDSHTHTTTTDAFYHAAGEIGNYRNIVTAYTGLVATQYIQLASVGGGTSNYNHNHIINGGVGTGGADVAAATTSNLPKYLDTLFIIKAI